MKEEKRWNEKEKEDERKEEKRKEKIEEKRERRVKEKNQKRKGNTLIVFCFSHLQQILTENVSHNIIIFSH